MRLYWKLMLIYLAVILLVLAAAYGYMQPAMHEFLTAQVGDTLAREVRLAGTMVARRLSNGEAAGDLDDLADLIGRQLGVRATLVDSTGQVAGDSEVRREGLQELENHANRPEVIEAWAGAVGRSVRHSDTLETDMLYVARVVSGVSGGRMVVRLAMPVHDVSRMQSRVGGVIRIALGFGLLLAALMAYVMSRLASRPITDMARVARSVAAGDFTAQADVPASSAVELRDLGTALNEMRSEIQRRITDITVNNSRSEAVFSSITEGILVTDQEGRVLMTNRAFNRLFGVDRNGKGRMSVELIRNAEVQDAIEQTLSSGEATTQDMAHRGVPDRHFDVHVAPILQDGVGIGAVAVFYDITELRELERVRKDFVANVSHELRTPLTAIKGCADTLADGALADPEAAERFVRTIINHSNRLENLLSDLLDLSRLESGKLSLSREVCPVRRIVDGAAAAVRLFAEEKEISILPAVDTDVAVRCDPELVEQALVNLLDNAVKYTPNGGSVRVAVRELGGTPVDAAASSRTVSPASTYRPLPSSQQMLDLRVPEGESRGRIAIEVTDTGIGIPSDALPRLFERFYRVDKGRSRAMGGTGLGLSIVRHLMHAHGEDVYVTSELGKGSTFGITLTLAGGHSQQVS
jgi:two-component system, OmpR family, phosphate regulon sensor histidine kinase PhoR